MAEAQGDAELEAFLDGYIQDALAPYRGTLSPEVLAKFEEELRFMMLTHPAVFPKVARLRPRAVAAYTGELSDEAEDPSKTEAG